MDEIRVAATFLHRQWRVYRHLRRNQEDEPIHIAWNAARMPKIALWWKDVNHHPSALAFALWAGGTVTTYYHKIKRLRYPWLKNPPAQLSLLAASGCILPLRGRWGELVFHPPRWRRDAHRSTLRRK